MKSSESSQATETSTKPDLDLVHFAETLVAIKHAAIEHADSQEPR